jgi:superoxide reductase
MLIFICEVCGHIEFISVPENCPVCFATSDKFKQNDSIFKDSEENSPEASVKHIPDLLIEKKCGLIPEEGCVDVHVRVGKTLHPMEEKHFIQFIDCYIDKNFAGRAFLQPVLLNPAAAFHMKVSSGEITIVENCNLHGYWMATESI